MAVLGNDILIYLDGDPIGGVKSDDIQSDVDLIEVASPLQDSGGYREYIPGRKSWSFSVNHLILVSAEVQALLQVGTEFDVLIKGRTASASTGVTGKAILTSCKITATRGNLTQGSFSFKGSSDLVAGE